MEKEEIIAVRDKNNLPLKIKAMEFTVEILNGNANQSPDKLKENITEIFNTVYNLLSQSKE